MLSHALEIRPGLTSIIGSGGKSTLLRLLGRELAQRGRVVLLTTAKMLPVPGVPLLLSPDAAALKKALEKSRAVCIGCMDKNTGKLLPPEVPMSTLLSLCDFALAEADGSAGLPLKAHASHEPPVAPESGQSIMLVGASGLGRPIAQCAHRPELFARLAGCSAEAPASPQRTVRVLRAEALYTRVFINQYEQVPGAAEELARLLDGPVLTGDLKKGVFKLQGE